MPLVEGCPLWESSALGLLWEPLPRVALPDDVVPLQEAICCLSSVDTVTMHSSEGCGAAAAHGLCMWEPMLCMDFVAGAWAVEWMVRDDNVEMRRHDMRLIIKEESCLRNSCLGALTSKTHSLCWCLFVWEEFQPCLSEVCCQ